MPDKRVRIKPIPSKTVVFGGPKVPQSAAAKKEFAVARILADAGATAALGPLAHYDIPAQKIKKR
jgi:hypothetical protein